MRTNNEDLRRAYQSYVMEKTPDSREGCPTPEMLVDSFDPKTSQETKDGIVAHLSGCSSCASEFEFIRQALNAGENLSHALNNIHGKRPVPSSGSRRFFPLFRHSWAYVLVSMFLISAGAAFLIIRNAHERDDGRGRTGSAPYLIQPLEPIRRSAPLIFKWEAMAGIEYYLVEVSNESLLPIWESPRVFSPTLVVPPVIQARLVKERICYWSVLAFDKNGNRSESEARRLVLIE